jgi:hypothetical protein
MRAVSAMLAALAVSLVASGCGGGIPKFQADTPLEDAYATLHKAGFRIAVRDPFSGPLEADSFNGLVALRVLPRRRDVVTLVAGHPTGLASQAGLRYPARVRVPNLVGGSVQAAMAWAGAHGVPWVIRKLPDLPPSSAPQLYLAYRVVGQSPGGGTTITQNHWLTLKIEPR